MYNYNYILNYQSVVKFMIKTNIFNKVIQNVDYINDFCIKTLIAHLTEICIIVVSKLLNCIYQDKR